MPMPMLTTGATDELDLQRRPAEDPQLLDGARSPENLWIKCPETGQLVFYKDVEANQFVIPGSNYHMRMSATARLKSMFDGEHLARHRACPRCRSIRSSSATSAATPTA